MTTHRHAAARFALLGLALFAAREVWQAGMRAATGPEVEHIVVSAAEARALGQHSGTQSPLSVPLGRRIDDELLWREGLRLGLDRSDPVVRARLVRNLRFAHRRGAAERGARAGARAEDEDALLREALRLGMHRSDTVVRRRVVARTRELLARRHRAAAIPHGAGSWRTVGSEPGTESTGTLASRRSEARRRVRQRFLGPGGLPSIPHDLGWISRRELAARLGSRFADAVFALPAFPDARTQHSAFGPHRVWVDGARAASLQPARDVASSARALGELERRNAAIATGLAELRRQARVEIDWRGQHAERTTP